MKLRKLMALTMAAVMALSLPGCSSGGKAGESSAPQTAAEKKEAAAETEEAKTEAAAAETEKKSDVKLTVTIWDANQEPGIKEILSGFTAKTGIATELQVVAWREYWTMLEAGAQGGVLPDVFWMHSNESQRYMSNDMLLDLTDRIAASKEIDLKNYVAEITSLYTLDGRNYAIPKDIDTIALWYNKTMFDEAGIPYPDDTWTWETYVETARKLTKPDGSQFGTALGSNSTADGRYNIIYSMGGEVIHSDKKSSGYDDPNTIKAMGLVDRLIKDGSMPTQEAMSETKPEVMFSSGLIAMVLQGSWLLPYHRTNEYSMANGAVAIIPKAEDGTRKTIYNGLGWAASANTKHPEEAWQLLEYLGSREAQQKQAELGVTMSAYAGTSEEWAKCAPEFNLQPYLDVMKPENMVIRPYSKTTVTWENKVNDVFKSAWSGEMTMEDTCREAAKTMNEILAEE